MQSASSRHRWSSAWSSIVTTRSSGPTSRASTRMNVVLPAPAPPDTRMLRRAATADSRNVMSSRGKKPEAASASRSRNRSGGWRRMVTLIGRAGGDSAACRRLPSGSVIVTVGLARSRRALGVPSVYQWTSSTRPASSAKGGGSTWRRPPLKTKQASVPLMRTSSTSGSARCSASGPSGVTAANTRRHSCSASSWVPGGVACRCSSPTTRPTSS